MNMKRKKVDKKVRQKEGKKKNRMKIQDDEKEVNKAKK